MPVNASGFTVSLGAGTDMAVWYADPDTKAWLDQHIDPVFGYPGIVRFSWQTCENLLTQRGVPITWYVKSALLLR